MCIFLLWRHTGGFLAPHNSLLTSHFFVFYLEPMKILTFLACSYKSIMLLCVYEQLPVISYQLPVVFREELKKLYDMGCLTPNLSVKWSLWTFEDQHTNL